MENVRDAKAINDDYTKLCAQWGHKAYLLELLPKEISELKKRMDQLGLELRALEEKTNEPKST